MYEQDIARGVALLDDQLPDWRERVSVDDLDLEVVSRCVVGQALGVVSSVRFAPTDLTWYGALERLGAPGISSNWGTDETVKWAENHGFDARRLNPAYRDYGRLTFEWAAYLTGNLDLPDPTETTSPEDTK